MRITQKSIIAPYERALQEIQERQLKEQTRLTTGKDLTDLSDDPTRLVDVKGLNAALGRNEQYLNNIETTLEELRTVSDTLDYFQQKIINIREIVIDSTQTGVATDISTFAIDVKNMLTDLISDANSEFNGYYIFAGTKNTALSLQPTGMQKTDQPFEIIEGESTIDNPSGLTVVFKGNFKERLIDKDMKTTEVVNMTADNIFGEQGTEFFGAVIDLYNIMAYNADGTKRTIEPYTTEGIAKIDEAQQRLMSYYDKIALAGSTNGNRMNRLTLIRDQMTEENLRIQEYLSTKEDTDIAKTSIRLKQEETALQYTLQVGATIFNNSLFDFLT